MILIYGEARKNTREAVRIYRERYPDRYIPDHTMFSRLEQNLRQNTDAFSRQKGIPKRKTILTDEKVAEILQYFHNHPYNSIRQASRQLNVSFGAVQHVLKTNKYHDYKMHNLQLLTPFDMERRMDFVAEMMIRQNDERNFLGHILWTDESRFVSNGKPNRKNLHYWAEENPHVVNQIQNQGHFGVNVWCGLIGNHLVGPYFFNETLNGANYLHFLNYTLPVLLENVPLQLRRNMWYQHDGAPPHTTGAVGDFLNERFPARWIGVRSPTIRWAPKSPDLTPLDFFLWGSLKDIVYKTATNDIDHLKAKITDACNSLTAEIIYKATHRGLAKRLELCMVEEGRHIENLF